MSKTLLSRVKPLNKITQPHSFPFEPHTKYLIHDVIHILKTHEKWEQALETRLSRDQIPPSSIAHQLFDKIHNPELGLKFFDWVTKRPYGHSLDGFAYSSLLNLLAKFRVFSEVELLLKCMKDEKIMPTRDALSALIREYSDYGLVDKGLGMYYFVVENYKFVPDVYACNALLNVLVRVNRIEIARRVYDEMVKRDGCENGCVDNYSVCIMARGLCKEGKVEEGRKLIEDWCGEGCVPNIVFYNTLIDGYINKGDIEMANEIFKELKLKGFLPMVETYGTMIKGFCKGGNFEAIDRLLKEMKARGLVVNVQVYNNIIDARCKHDNVAKALDIVKEMMENDCEPDIVTYNTLINSSCKAGKLKEADQLFELATERGLVPNKLSYTPLIHEYNQQGEFIKASKFLVEMTTRGHVPDLVSYGALVHGLVAAGEVNVALTVRDKMIERGVVPDADVYNVLMNGLFKKGNFSAAKLLLSDMLDQNVLPDEFVYATLIDGFIRSGHLNEARKIFELTFEKGGPGVVGYNAMIKGFCKFGMMNEAMSSICKMRKGHLVPDEVTYSTVIDGYVKQDNLNRALMMFGAMVKQKCKPNVVTYTSVINGFGRKGDSSSAEKTLRKMQSCGLEPNVVTYSTLIGNFCKEGQLDKATLFFEEMLRNKCIPNDVTFHYLLNGFTHGAPIATSAEGMESQKHNRSIFLCFFRRMISDGWLPRTATYNCILICLCQYGMLKIALQLMEKMLKKGTFMDSVSFVALLHGVCMEGRSNEWKNVISFNLNVPELQISSKYSLMLDQYLHQELPSEASLILQTLMEDHKFIARS